ncbi:MAG: NADH-quinone oxidoreductase subunit NuoN [Gammaproteobacteria bacterium]|nr:NADH-quinone oxidoreductase subunit NuoN [Gammaproteobacteria bacterium]
MNFNFMPAIPEIFLLGMVCIVMLADVFLEKYVERITYSLAQFALVATLLLVIQQANQFTDVVTTLSGQYVLDRIAILTKIFVLFTTVFAFIYARQYLTMRRITGNEYYILGLLSVLGMMVMSSAGSFLSIYLGLELLSLALYAMIALDKNSKFATEAAMKYFIMGAMASGLLLYGISLIYGATGSLDIHTVATQLHQATASANTMALIGVIFLLAGLLFKFGAVPFHMWVPDVYEGAPTCMTLFIACAPKIATFCIATRILVNALPDSTAHWQAILIVIAILSMFSGNVMAIAQTSFKRMLAYSSIAHMGYMLLGLIAGPNSTLGYSAAMFYIVTYVLVAAGAFAVIALLARPGSEFDQLNDLRGLNARDPWLAFMLLLLMFSMAGVPPTVGFFAKLGLLEALVQAHDVWLAALALVFAIIGAYYYLRVVMLMYFEEPTHAALNRPIALTRGSLVAISINGFAALGLGLLPSALIDLCRVTLG